MNRALLPGLSFAIVQGVALAQSDLPHVENFDDYRLGPLAAQSNWETWDEVPTVDALVVDERGRSGRQSIKVVANEGGQVDTDLIMRYFPHNFEGCYEYTVYQYIPDTQSGETYFIMQSVYNHHGPYVWAVQVHMNAAAGIVEAGRGRQAKLIPNEWVEIKVEINFAADTHQIYYGGTPLMPPNASWKDAMNGGNPPQVGSSDWYANNTCCAYYDDLNFVKVECPGQGEPCGRRASLSAKCKRGGAKVTARLRKADPDTEVTFRVDGGREVDRRTDLRGKARARWSGLNRGSHRVTVCDLEDEC
ncbi:MAG: hypothetical protein C4547_16800 [Phycisphaerales bacterium]|nr:MAG: hypothetical protein C4547_16800 [Phycisphaerales bacterium]